MLFISLMTIREMKGGKREEKERPNPSACWVGPGQTAEATKLFQYPQEPPFLLSIRTENGSSSQHGQHPSLSWGRHVLPPASPPHPLGQWALLFPHSPWQFADVKLYPRGPIKYKGRQIRIIAQKFILKKKGNKQTTIKAMELKPCLFPGSC